MADDDWREFIRVAVRECARTWELQVGAGRFTPEARDAIASRALVLLMQRLDGQPPAAVATLLPEMLRTMLATFLDVLAERDLGR